MTATSFVPRTVALVDSQGRVTEQWHALLQELYLASGLAGHARPLWDELFVPSSALRPDSSAPAVVAAPAAGVELLSYAAGADTTAHGQAKLPPTYDSSTDIVPVVLWMPETADTGSVSWSLGYSWTAQGSALASPQSLAVDTAGTGTPLEVESIAGTAIPGASMAPGSVLSFSLSRLGSADGFTGKAFLLGVGFFFERVAIGARNRGT